MSERKGPRVLREHEVGSLVSLEDWMTEFEEAELVEMLRGWQTIQIGWRRAGDRRRERIKRLKNISQILGESP